ncbi:MAG: hypothetical protein ABIA04_08815 [Pseudomonadota bacterium]
MNTTLNSFEKDFAIAAIAIDTLWGGNYKDKTGEAHLIVDAYCSGKEEPDVEPEDLKNLFLKGGVTVTDQKAIEKFICANQIYERLERVKAYTSTLENEFRRDYLNNAYSVLSVILELRKQAALMSDNVKDVDAYKIALGREPKYIEHEDIKENLIKYLDKAGFKLTPGKTLNMILDEFNEKNMLDADTMEELWPIYSEEMNKLTKERIYPYLPAWVNEIPLDAVDYAIMREEVSYSGLNLALHTIKDNVPIYNTIIRMSDKVTRTKTSYKLGLVAHEGAPGHGLHLPLTHALYARGAFGFETTMLFLGSPFATIGEGIATTTSELLFGSNLSDYLTNEELIATYEDYLNVCGRNNVVIRYLEGEKNPENLAKYLYDEYCFSESNSKKYTGWLFHEKMGKLLGLMYLPSYGIGCMAVRNAIKKHGREKVIPAVYGINGQVDIVNFEKAIL